MLQTLLYWTFLLKVFYSVTKCLKLFYIEHTVHGYFLGAYTVLYVAGSLGYLRIKHPSFKVHSLECKCTLIALFPCKIIRWKTGLKLFYIEHRVHGYFLGACKVLYIAGSLRYLRIKHPCFNAHSVQCKRTLYALFPCEIHWLTWWWDPLKDGRQCLLKPHCKDLAREQLWGKSLNWLNRECLSPNNYPCA